MMANIKKIDFTVDRKNLEQSVLDLLHTLWPNWKEQEVHMQQIDGGFMNKMVCCLPSDKADDGVVVRIFKDADVSDQITDRDAEVMGLQLAHAADCGTPLRAMFTNGLVVGYFSGRNVTYQDYFNPSVMRHIQAALARFHALDVDSVPLVDFHGNTTKVPKTNVFFPRLRDQLRITPSHPSKPDKAKLFEETIGSLGQLQNELVFLEKLLKEFDFPVVSSMNDCHQRNIMYNDLTNQVILVDFEYYGFSYEAVEFGFASIGHTLMLYSKFCKPGDGKVREEDVRSWAEWYVEARAQVRGETYTEAEVDEYHMQSQIMYIVALFSRCITFLSLSEDLFLEESGFNFVYMSCYLWKKYNNHKSKLLSLIESYRGRHLEKTGN